MRVWKDVMSVHTFIPSYGLQRSWHSCPRRVNASNKNTSSVHHPQRRNVTASMVGLKKKTVTYAKISPHMMDPRDIAGERRRRRRQGNECDAPNWRTYSFKLWAPAMRQNQPPELRVESLGTATEVCQLRYLPSHLRQSTLLNSEHRGQGHLRWLDNTLSKYETNKINSKLANKQWIINHTWLSLWGGDSICYVATGESSLSRTPWWQAGGTCTWLGPLQLCVGRSAAQSLPPDTQWYV